MLKSKKITSKSKVKIDSKLQEKLKSKKNAAAYLTKALEDKNSQIFLLALRDVMLAQGGLAKVANAAGVNRESLYKAVSKNGNPSLSYLKAVIDSMEMRITLV